jgi:uncharacterized protein YegJ (DUF2314 family)
MTHRPAIAAALAVLAAVACTQPITGRVNDDETTRRQNEALAMRRAAEKAQATLDEFLTKAMQLPAGTKSYALKVAIRDGGDTEYFWVNEFSWSDGAFVGRINDEPRLVRSVRPGQIHKFGRLDIVDWTYVDETSGKTHGNFTACALLSTQPPAEAAKLERRNDLDCS